MQDDTMEKNDAAKVEIVISDDETEAYMKLPPTQDGKLYTVELLKVYLKEEGIISGIKEDVLRKIIAEERYNEKVLVAEGIRVQDGKDGWFEFLFDTEVNTRPKILKDGSVDYTPCGDVPAVHEGEKIVIYHPAAEPKDGLNVFGQVLAGRRGKELARLKGKGFIVSDDNREYTARYTGKVTYKDDWLQVDEELTINEDVSYTTTGSISFVGNIHIKGNVLSGMEVISERGGIIVDGFVEAAELKAKKDIVLKNGMQGNGKGKIECEESVSGKFFEQTVVICKGDVHANAIMNCQIEAGQDILVSGRFGIIVGGKVSALRRVQAMIVGNAAEKKTEIHSGVEGDLFAQMAKCEHDMNALQEELNDIKRKADKLDELMKYTDREDIRQGKVVLLRSKVEKDSQINELLKRKQELVDLMAKSNEAKVTIEKVVYPGVSIIINGMSVVVTDEINHVEYARRGSGIISYNIE